MCARCIDDDGECLMDVRSTHHKKDARPRPCSRSKCAACKGKQKHPTLGFLICRYLGRVALALACIPKSIFRSHSRANQQVIVLTFLERAGLDKSPESRDSPLIWLSGRRHVRVTHAPDIYLQHTDWRHLNVIFHCTVDRLNGVVCVEFHPNWWFGCQFINVRLFGKCSWLVPTRLPFSLRESISTLTRIQDAPSSSRSHNFTPSPFV